MKKFASFIPAVALIFVISCGTKQESQPVDTPERDKTQVDTTASTYVCPMNCENSASNEPGRCKVCGMELEQKK